MNPMGSVRRYSVAVTLQIPATSRGDAERLLCAACLAPEPTAGKATGEPAVCPERRAPVAG